MDISRNEFVTGTAEVKQRDKVEMVWTRVKHGQLMQRLLRLMVVVNGSIENVGMIHCGNPLREQQKKEDKYVTP